MFIHSCAMLDSQRVVCGFGYRIHRQVGPIFWCYAGGGNLRKPPKSNGLKHGKTSWLDILFRILADCEHQHHLPMRMKKGCSCADIIEVASNPRGSTSAVDFGALPGKSTVCYGKSLESSCQKPLRNIEQKKIQIFHRKLCEKST